MPSSASSDLQGAVLRTLATLWRDVHDRARRAIVGLDDAALDRVLGPDTNSIAVLITHLVGSESEAIASVLELPSDRERAAEFRVRSDTMTLHGLLDAADGRVSALVGAVDRIDLLKERVRKNDPTPRSGLAQLIASYAHSREHVAHIELTSQLLSAPGGGGPAPLP